MTPTYDKPNHGDPQNGSPNFRKLLHSGARLWGFRCGVLGFGFGFGLFGLLFGNDGYSRRKHENGACAVRPFFFLDVRGLFR